MALRFRELPWYVQTGLYFLVAVGIFAAGELLEISPVKARIDERAKLERDHQKLVAEVSRLQAVKQQHADFQARLQSLEEQLARSRTFVPEAKQTDDFMRTLENAALNTQISMRRLSSESVVMKEFYAEMPFEVDLDGAYYNLAQFFTRLGGTTRIINAGQLELQGSEGARGQYQYTPGTTVVGSCTITTYYTPSEEELAAAAPPAAGRRGGRR